MFTNGKRSRRKSFYDYRGFTGPDIDIETSLREYGMIWKEVKPGEYLFVYGLPYRMGDDCEYKRFTYAYLSKDDFSAMIRESWFDLSDFVSFTGLKAENIENMFPSIVSDAVAYRGMENIFGACYDEGYEIGK